MPAPPKLPIRAHAADIVGAVRANPVTVVIGETGSGKTTQIAQILLDAGLAGGQDGGGGEEHQRLRGRLAALAQGALGQAEGLAKLEWHVRKPWNLLLSDRKMVYNPSQDVPAYRFFVRISSG